MGAGGGLAALPTDAVVLAEDDLLHWVESAEVRADGSVLSWVNPDHPGYEYPEAAGFVISALARRGRSIDVAERIAGRLCGIVQSFGAVGKDGRAYLFDSAIVLEGLAALRARTGASAIDPALSRLFDFVADRVEAKSAVASVPVGPPRWSTSFSPHLLRVAKVLLSHSAATGEARSQPVVERLVEELVPRLSFPDAGAPPVYVHAVCYALEGLTALAAAGHRELAPLALEGADWLSRQQLRNGALPAWSATSAVGHADATAQSVLLWSSVDRDRFAASISAALEYLRSLLHPCGGIRYRTGSNDVNTWCTVFTAEALCALGRESA